MANTTTLNEVLRSPIDGTEFVRLATAGANWKAQLGTQTWILGGIAGGTGAGSTLTIQSTTGLGTSDALIFQTGAQVTTLTIGTDQSWSASSNKAQGTGFNWNSNTTTPHTAVGDACGSFSFNLAASSAVNELLGVALYAVGNNSLTGGGHIQNMRLVDATGSNASGAVVDNWIALFTEGVNSGSVGTYYGVNINDCGGTITTSYGVLVNALSGATKYGFFDNSGGSSILPVIAGGTSASSSLTLKGNVTINTGAIGTNATDGFLYVETCAGQPTGTPTSFTGRVPIVFDTTNSQFWIYTGGAWKQPKTPAAAAIVTWQ